MSSRKTLSNQEIADLLREVSAALEVKNADQFRVRAYSVAADSIEKEGTSLYTLWKNDQIDDIPNIGEKLTLHLSELFKTGTPTYLNKIKAKVPAGMFPLLKVEGIGPQYAFKIAEHLKLTSEKTALQKALEGAQQGKIAEIEGLGEKTQELLVEVLPQMIENFGKSEARIRIDIAESISIEVLEYIKKNAAVFEASALGSLRRERPTIGDIDLGIATNEPSKIREVLQSYPENQKTISSGESMIRFQHKSGYGVDIKIVKPEEWGSLLQHFTGSKAHNIALREYALKMSLSLSEYGIKDTKTEKLYTFSSEEAFYKKLKLDWIPPEIRENIGEIELAKLGKLPQLLELQDIKGDFHTHSNFDWKSSHDYGENSFEEIIKAALQKGYKFIGLGDHNPASSYSQKELQKLFEKRAQIITKLQKKYPEIKIYNSLEVDIKPDGSLALPDDLLEPFDYIVASVHSNLSMDITEMTNRVLKALKHKKVRVLGHPTGKMLHKRSGFELEWEKIFAACKKHTVALEVNASPVRLDIDEVIVKEATKHEVKIAINTDAHTVSHLDFMKYGVYVARRGLATKKDCLNCSANPI